MVGDRVIMRDRLVRDVVTGLAVPALVILPLLAGLIWVVVGRGLAPLTGIAGELRRRKSDDLTPIGPAPRATELRPVVTALNDLFDRVSRDRDRERSFTTYAAHELKTPLAGISAQAQIAQRASDPAMREAALAQIIGAVRRTDHVVRQLLDLASVDGGADGADCDEPLELAEVLRAVIADLSPLAEARGLQVETDLPRHPAPLSAPRFLIWVALRNPVENAILASPKGRRCALHWRRLRKAAKARCGGCRSAMRAPASRPKSGSARRSAFSRSRGLGEWQRPRPFDHGGGDGTSGRQFHARRRYFGRDGRNPRFSRSAGRGVIARL
ncbi:histidine kinase dimerization/phospho-acceptor domain-containing protein [Paracoccus cavernae]|uniref:histidine kinase dimerization/phospho-acceptor domain-containing protein n=1 Tax=Paracoccus cavernae TaxID=1571207 RepID=UPI00364531C8